VHPSCCSLSQIGGGEIGRKEFPPLSPCREEREPEGKRGYAIAAKCQNLA
jgi:hypothetical protein